jgi:hypothetical protein
MAALLDSPLGITLTDSGHAWIDDYLDNCSGKNGHRLERHGDSLTLIVEIPGVLACVQLEKGIHWF